MRDDLDFITVTIREIDVPPDADEPEYLQGDLSVLASLSGEALEYLQFLRPVVVARPNRRSKAYKLVGGFGTFRVLRAARGEESAVRALDIRNADVASVQALDLLVAPALEGAGSSDTVIRRWMSAIQERPQTLEALGFTGMSRSALAALLGVSRKTLYRANESREESPVNGDEEK